MSSKKICLPVLKYAEQQIARYTSRSVKILLHYLDYELAVLNHHQINHDWGLFNQQSIYKIFLDFLSLSERLDVSFSELWLKYWELWLYLHVFEDYTLKNETKKEIKYTVSYLFMIFYFAWIIQSMLTFLKIKKNVFTQNNIFLKEFSFLEFSQYYFMYSI